MRTTRIEQEKIVIETSYWDRKRFHRFLCIRPVVYYKHTYVMITIIDEYVKYSNNNRNPSPDCIATVPTVWYFLNFFKIIYARAETSSSSAKQATGPGLLKDSPYSIS